MADKRPVNPITGEPMTDEEIERLNALATRLVVEGPGTPPPDDDDSDASDETSGG
jgi:hypothetical protein